MKRYEGGPWRIETTSGGLVRIGTKACPSLILMGGRGEEHSRLNGARLREMLNACDGIPTAELERMTQEWKSRPRIRAVSVRKEAALA